jgi:hypothetical protein
VNKFLIFLVSFNLAAKNELFTWKTGCDSAKPVSESISSYAQKKHNWLNNSCFYQVFKTSNAIMDCDQAPEKRTFLAQDGTTFTGYFFDRKSDKVVMIVPPYGARAKHIMRYAGIFKEYDVLILEYRVSTNTCIPAQIYSFFSAPSTKNITNRQADIKQALLWLQKRNYIQVVGCAQCYGSWLTLYAQEALELAGKPGFDKLIIDSCPLGSRELCKKFIQDPVAVSTFGKREGPQWLTAVTGCYLMEKFWMTVTDPFYSDISIAKILKNISVPILFFHGRGDLLVDQEQFEVMYNAVDHEKKCALITPFKHLHHSLKAKELYREVTQQFIDGVLV